MISSHTRCAFGAISLCASLRPHHSRRPRMQGHVHKRAIAQAQTGAASVAPPREPTLAEVRQATERFQDIKVALAEGYIRDPADLCETAEIEGAASGTRRDGVHYSVPIFSASRRRRTRVSMAPEPTPTF